MNKINQVFANRGDKKLLSLYFCAGCPTLDGTADVIKAMERHGIDFVEVGMPFSDPLADGPVIQSAGTVALKNGMTLKVENQKFGDFLVKKLQRYIVPMLGLGFICVLFDLFIKWLLNSPIPDHFLFIESTFLFYYQP